MPEELRNISSIQTFKKQIRKVELKPVPGSEIVGNARSNKKKETNRGAISGYPKLYRSCCKNVEMVAEKNKSKHVKFPFSLAQKQNIRLFVILLQVHQLSLKLF